MKRFGLISAICGASTIIVVNPLSLHVAMLCCTLIVVGAILHGCASIIEAIKPQSDDRERRRYRI
jgi:hypothetical protein